MRSWITIQRALIFSLLALTTTSTAFAFEEGKFRLGAQAGHVGLLGDVGREDQNALGFGGFFNYFTTEEMAFEVGYLQSSHTDITHSDLSAGVNFYLASYDAAYPHLSGGVSFINNELKAYDINADGFALYVGGGFDFEMSRNLAAGIQARYQKAFESSKRIGGVDVKTVQDSVNVMLRLMYVFGGDR